MRVALVVLIISVNIYAAFCCTIEQEMALLSALKGMKECKKCALLNLWKPLDCKGPELTLPKWKWSKGCEWEKPQVTECAKGKGYETPLSPLVYLLPSPAPLPPPLALHQLQPQYLAAPPPQQFLAAPPPQQFLAAPPAQQFLAAPPPQQFLAAPPPQQFLGSPPPPCSCAQPRPAWTESAQTCPAPACLPPAPTCPAPSPQQFFYVPQPRPTYPKQSPLLYLSKKGW